MMRSRGRPGIVGALCYPLLGAGVRRFSTGGFGKGCGNVRKVLRTTGGERLAQEMGSSYLIENQRDS
jgi:hypothetical protein